MNGTSRGEMDQAKGKIKFLLSFGYFVPFFFISSAQFNNFKSEKKKNK